MDEQEYRVPVKLLTKREPIFFNHLSGLEAAQWLAVGAITYFVFNLLPLGLVLKIGLLGGLLMLGFVFIHVPINGLTGIEWLYIAMRYRVEEEQHQAQPPLTATLPVFELLDEIELATEDDEADLEITFLNVSYDEAGL